MKCIITIWLVAFIAFACVLFFFFFQPFFFFFFNIFFVFYSTSTTTLSPFIFNQVSNTNIGYIFSVDNQLFSPLRLRDVHKRQAFCQLGVGILLRIEIIEIWTQITMPFRMAIGIQNGGTATP